MKVLKPYIQVEIVEDKKPAIILMDEKSLANKELVVIQAYEGSILEKGDTLFCNNGVEVAKKTFNGKDYFFLDERIVIAAEEI